MHVVEHSKRISDFGIHGGMVFINEGSDPLNPRINIVKGKKASTQDLLELPREHPPALPRDRASDTNWLAHHAELDDVQIPNAFGRYGSVVIVVPTRASRAR